LASPTKPDEWHATILENGQSATGAPAIDCIWLARSIGREIELPPTSWTPTDYPNDLYWRL